jgi:hypothetical protein
MDGQRNLRSPTFFVSQEDTSFKTEYFPQGGEAERRIHFFAQSLTTPMPAPHPVQCMPLFTVLTVSFYDVFSFEFFVLSSFFILCSLTMEKRFFYRFEKSFVKRIIVLV